MKRALAGSVLLHAALFFLFFAAPPSTDVSPYAVEMVTLRPVPSRRASPSPAPAAPARAETADTAPADGPAAPPAVAGGGEDGRAPETALEAYLGGLRERIDRHKTYPRISIARKETGTVVIRLTVQRDGTLSKLELVEPSRFARLNEAAMQAAAAAAPFEPLPAALRQAEWRINFPVRFALGSF